MSAAATIEDEVKTEARSVGFDLVGIAPAGGWASGERLSGWLEAGHAGEMEWIAREADVRADPRVRYPWARSAVLVALDYRTRDAAAPAERRAFSRYAWGDDYHALMARMLKDLKARLLRRFAPAEARWYVDDGPVLERAAAAAAGLGWIAKNTMVISEQRGSFFFLGALLVSMDLAPDRAAPGRCGTCARCLVACPTRAFVAPYILDARRCISYLTIELEGPIPRDLRAAMGELAFGCDICQEVCPWVGRADRRGPEAPDRPAFRARAGLAEASTEELAALLALDDAGFREHFARSPVKRAKRFRLARNLCVALGNRGDPAALPALERALEADPKPVVRGHAAWALGEIGRKTVRRAQVEGPLERSALTDADSSVRDEARAALEELRAPETVSASPATVGGGRS